MVGGAGDDGGCEAAGEAAEIGAEAGVGDGDAADPSGEGERDFEVGVVAAVASEPFRATW
jgi:hypothetical protein